MRLMLVRHGATVSNVEKRYTGQSDVPLSPLGLRQVEALAEALAAERFDVILSSDLLRAQQTTAAIAQRNDAPVRLDPDLREIAMGVWEGHTHAEIASLHGEELARWQEHPDLYAPSGGETILQLRDRAASALARSLAEYPDGHVLWVTHGGLIGILLCHLLGIDLAHRWQFRRDNGAITALDVGADYAILMRMNDRCHLTAVGQTAIKEERQVL
ncbi:MAG: alpha-ribazole phosphatase [Ktedonobacterales bacterium]